MLTKILIIIIILLSLALAKIYYHDKEYFIYLISQGTPWDQAVKDYK